MAHDPEPNPSRPRKQRSIPHNASEIEVSAGIVEAKHFAGVLGGPLLLFLLIIRQTPHRSVRWQPDRSRPHAWHPVRRLCDDSGRPERTVQRWLAQLEAAGYLVIRRSKLGLKIQLAKRIWFQRRQAFITTIVPIDPIPATSGTNGITLSPPLLTAIPATSGTLGGGSGGDRPSEAAPDAGFVISPHRTSPQEEASPPEASASLKVNTLPDPNLPWPPMPRKARRLNQ